MKKNSFVEGTFWASITLIIIKVLGAIYVIPFYGIVGELGGALYSYAFSIYSFVIDLCVAGIPLAISKIVSEYNTLEMYDAKERTLKVGNKIVIIMSSILFLALFIFAKEAAYLFIGNNTDGNSIESIELVIRSISFCLLIVPLLAVKKGYLQGQGYITPSTNSQLIEQIVRISFILVGSYLAIRVFKQNIDIGVAIAVLGSFFGGVVAYLYLTFKINRNKDSIIKPKKKEVDKVSNKQIAKKIFKFSIPVIIIAAAADVYNITDISLIIRGLGMIGYSGAEAETVASVIATWASKICLIVNAFAYALSISLIPNMVSSLVKKDYKAVNNFFVKSVGTMVLVGLPLAAGISILANETYMLFYGYSKYGSLVLRILPFSVLLSNTSYVINATQQSLSKYKIIYLSVFSGLLTNALLDIPLILLCNKIGIYPYYGAIFSTLIGLFITITITTRSLKKSIDFSYKYLFSVIARCVYPCLIMSVVVFGISCVFKGQFNTRTTVIIPMAISGIVGAIIYIYITYKNKVLIEVLGENFIDKIKSKLKIKRN